MRILIVEDTHSVAQGYVELLNRAGHSCEVVERQTDALALATGEQFDLMILDLNLAEGDGISVLKELRAGAHVLPVFVVSARADLEDRVTLLNAGADDYLVKPFAVDEFLARVEALLRRPSALVPQQQRFGGVLFDSQNGSVAGFDGAPIAVTPRERAVLAALLRNPGELVGKEQLADLLFSLTSNVAPSAVEVYVSRLRGKLRASAVGIKSVRGLGYYLTELDNSA